MAGILMAVESRWRSQEACHVVQVVHVILEAGDLFQDLGGASIVELTGTGLVIAKLVIGRTSATVVEIVVILRGIVRIARKSSNVGGVTRGHHLLVVAEVEVSV